MGGCKVGPNYRAPQVPAPPAYSGDGRNGNWTTAQPADAQDRGAWWEIYRDAELNDLEQRCAAANQNIAAALHVYEQAHAIVRENRASLFPTVTVGADASRSRISASKPLRSTAASYWDFLIPLDISWEPDLWGGIRRQIESSAAAAQASAADLADTRLSLQGLLAVTYLQLRGIDLQAQLLRSTIDTYAQAAQLTQSRYVGGLATQSDVAQAQAQLEATRAQLVDLSVQRQQDEHAIAVLVGVPAPGFRISERALAGDPPSIPTGIPSELLQRRPDIAAAERRVAATNAQIGIAQASFYPQISLGATGAVESSAISRLFSSGSAEWSAGPSVSQILFDAGRRRAQMEAAVAAREQATALYRQQVLSAFRDVEDQLSALRVLEEEAAVQGRAVDAAKQSVDLSLIRYKGGIATYLEVLTNQTILLNDQRAAAALAARRVIASVELQIALGGGWNTAQLPSN
jgi:NodT family efflux transporter outer membrane factor (OMF) lipoprotein